MSHAGRAGQRIERTGDRSTGHGQAIESSTGLSIFRFLFCCSSSFNLDLGEERRGKDEATRPRVSRATSAFSLPRHASAIQRERERVSEKERGSLFISARLAGTGEENGKGRRRRQRGASSPIAATGPRKSFFRLFFFFFFFPARTFWDFFCSSSFRFPAFLASFAPAYGAIASKFQKQNTRESQRQRKRADF